MWGQGTGVRNQLGLRHIIFSFSIISADYVYFKIAYNHFCCLFKTKVSTQGLGKLLIIYSAVFIFPMAKEGKIYITLVVLFSLVKKYVFIALYTVDKL